MKEMDLKKSLTVEFKSDRTKISDDVIVEAVVAMANTDGGDIYLGFEDDGQIMGLHKDHLDPTRLAAFVANKTVPSIHGRALPDYSASNDRSVRHFISKGVPDRGFVKMITEEQKRIGRSLPIYALLVLNALKQMHRGTIEEISSLSNLTESRVRTTIEGLVTSGLVEAIGTSRKRTYLLSSRVYEKTNDLLGYVRQKDIDVLRFEELVLSLAAKQGRVTRGDVVELLHTFKGLPGLETAG